MVEPTPITDAGLADIETDAKYARALGYVRMRMLTDDVDSLLARLRTSEARVAELEALAQDYEQVLASKRENIRLIDVAMHGEDGAAKQPSGCDLIEPARWLRERAEKAEAEVARLARINRELVRSHNALNLDGARLEGLLAAARTELAASRPDPAQPGQSSAQPLSDGAIYAAASRKNVSDAAVDEALGSAQPAADGYARYNRGAHMFGGDDE
jgi:hypothetical protein